MLTHILLSQTESNRDTICGINCRQSDY